MHIEGGGPPTSEQVRIDSAVQSAASAIRCAALDEAIAAVEAMLAQQRTVLLGNPAHARCYPGWYNSAQAYEAVAARLRSLKGQKP